MRQTRQNAFSMTQAVRDRLLHYDWPGNVRELRNFAFNAVLGVIPEEKPASLSEHNDTLADKVASYEGAIIRETLEMTRGSVVDCCRIFGLPRKTFYDKCQRAGIVPSDYR
jgi:two-component system, NtrC family, C4-dicarboxylate transport response regulator DctD